jgi:hypothetical protein
MSIGAEGAGRHPATEDDRRGQPADLRPRCGSVTNASTELLRNTR